jgi:uncharacterized protein (TIGR04255 family)
MATQRHLNNAPIVEAIIDIRAKLRDNFDVHEFLPLKEALINNYPVVETRREFELGGKIEVSGKREVGKFEQTFADKGIIGYLFKSHDGEKVVQFRKDGFTFSRLKPYTNWQEVVEEAKRLWKLYVDKASPEVITRIAVRYINQLDIPLPINNFAQYLTAPPIIPENLPQDVCHFLTKITILDEKTGIMANIIQGLQSISKKDYVAIMLDIDVFKSKESGSIGFTESELWPTFEQLRDLKNRIFFDSITEETVRLLE